LVANETGRERFQDRLTGMTRFVIDAGVGLYLVAEGIEVNPKHELLAPTLFRSQTLSLAHEPVRRGEIPANVAFEQLEKLWQIKIRLLGDAVLRRLAWKIADRLEGVSTYEAEYLALTQLQGDAFVTLDTGLARRVEGIVAVATVNDLR
jgi:predicted nucleic acid-binding protein